jgi:hypothetical protein
MVMEDFLILPHNLKLAKWKACGFRHKSKLIICGIVKIPIVFGKEEALDK